MRSLLTNSNVFFICKTISGKILGGYSTIHFTPSGSSKNESLPVTSFLFNIDASWEDGGEVSIFSLKSSHSPLTYDQ